MWWMLAAASTWPWTWRPSSGAASCTMLLLAGHHQPLGDSDCDAPFFVFYVLRRLLSRAFLARLAHAIALRRLLPRRCGAVVVVLGRIGCRLTRRPACSCHVDVDVDVGWCCEPSGTRTSRPGPMRNSSALTSLSYLPPPSCSLPMHTPFMALLPTVTLHALFTSPIGYPHGTAP